MTEEEKRDLNIRVTLAMGLREQWEIDGKDWYIPLAFCTDPAAADLVRLEIERRGWSVMIHCEPGGYTVDVIGAPKTEGYAVSTESPHHALCLAFLAACEEREEGK